ncbi:MAG: hypothetical protein ACI9T9_000324 [Oleiphilaceae bacterium]
MEARKGEGNMPYVVRQTGGIIKAIFNEATAESKEYLPANHPEIIEFMGADTLIAKEYQREANVRVALKDSDAEIARVTEDLVRLLVKKNVILFTELPEIVQEKLISRENLRTKLNAPKHTIISDDETL